ncbi:hypothetical protein B0H14DRAFT_2615357 [Mycena olivaceomarginata]|nr:hypothetical protein B0H14DRAFT_2615357 [Mycena olivaceomarginata]
MYHPNATAVQMPKEPTLSAHAARNPSQRSDATKATRALLVEQHHKQNLALDADLEEHHAKQEELIETLVLKYGRTDEYIRKLVCNGAKYGNKHGVNMKNAILHEYCNKAREEGGPSNVRDVQGEISGEEYQRIKGSLSKEDLARFRAQLEEHRDGKQHGVRATNKSCQLDAVQTANRVGKVLCNLYLRTGVAAFAIFTRGDLDDAAKPHIVDSDDASRFFIDVLKMSPLDAVRKMEQWACTRDKDVDANNADTVRSQITEMANNGLRKIKNRQKLVTEWSNYRLKMMHELGVEMAGWPSNIEIKPPSKLCADDARRIRDLLKTGLAQEIEAERAAGTVKKQRSDKDLPCGPRTKSATKGTEGEAGAPTATAQSPGDSVQPAAMQVPIQVPSNGIQAAMVLSPAVGLTGVGAPASSLVVGPASIAATASSPVAAITTPASSPVAAVTTPASEVSVASSAPALGSVAAPASSPVAAGPAPASEASVASSAPVLGSVAALASSPVAAITAPASVVSVASSAPVLGSVAALASSPVAAVTAPASVASSVPAFGSGVDSTPTVSSGTAFGLGLDFNFDFSFLDHPSFACEVPAEEDVLRLNTSNRDDDNWGFGGLSANSAIAHGVNGSASLVHTGGTLLSFNMDNEVFPAALMLPNANTTTAASTSATSVFSIATNTAGNTGKKRKRSGDDGGEKRPRKTRSDKDKPRGPRKNTTNTATANTRHVKAAAEAAPALLNAPPLIYALNPIEIFTMLPAFPLNTVPSSYTYSL